MDLKIIAYDQLRNELLADSDTAGRIRLDPFVGCCVDWKDAESLVGKRVRIADDTLFTSGAYCPLSMMML